MSGSWLRKDKGQGGGLSRKDPVKMHTNPEKLEATDLVVTPEEKEAIPEQQEVPNDDAAVVTTAALEASSGDQLWDTRTQANSGPQMILYAEPLKD
jgi:hypothetical protein